MRWAVFKDFRGVLYCEPINEGIEVWTKLVPVRRKSIFGSTGETSKYDLKLHFRFLDTHYSRGEYRADAFADAPKGFSRSTNKVYLQENCWGVVDVLHVIEDDNLGLKMQYQLRRLAPDGSMKIKDRNNLAKPHPQTDRILAMLRAS